MNQAELEAYIRKSYLSYSCMVLSGRALSYVQDGLKPVHRRILFAMHKLGMTSTSAYKKSARVIGDVIGKYHPHGDSAVYEAMVLMAQPWNLRYPLVDGQGNFGSRDGDSWAAMRYTEARTTPLADLMLSELNAGAVDSTPNFDGTLKEPEFLPCPLPIELLNGSTGIGVGMAADLPSHNVREVTNAVTAFIRNNDITVDELMEHLVGPDIPTGGHIVNTRAEINKAYKTGHGKLYVRPRWEVEKLSRGQWRILITELPLKMAPKDIEEKVANASVYEPPKDKDKKAAQSMLDLKQYIKNNIESVYDITSKDDPQGSARMIIEPKSSRQDPEEFMATAMKKLGLQVTMKFNLTAVSNDRHPRRRGILDIIKDWVDFRRITVTKRTETRLGKIKDRLELINGRLTIMDVIDEVIEIIRNYDEPRDELMKRFGLSEVQAEDILELRLRQLRKLEEYKLQEEKDKLIKEQSDLEALLASTRKMNNLLVREMEAATKKFEDDRKTLIEEAAPLSDSIASTVPSEPITLWLTKDNWIVGRKGHVEESETPANALKPGDKYVNFMQTKLDKQIIILGKSGRGYTISASSLSFGRGNGTHLNTLITLNGDAPFWMDEYTEGKRYLLANKEGYGYVTNSDDILSTKKAGKECFKLDADGHTLLSVLPVEIDDPMLNLWTDKKRLLQFPLSEVKHYPKSKGMRLISLGTDEILDGIALSESGTFIYKGRRKNLDDGYLKKRAAAPKKV